MNNKYCVLSMQNEKKFNEYSNTAIIICLYYEDMVDYYFSYLKLVPKEICIYIITSNRNLMKILEQKLQDIKNKTYLRFKNNRGRDISALLITSKDIFKKYKYVCFLHDKKAKNSMLIQDVKKWQQNLCENMLGGTGYINNILNYLQQNDKIGLLVAPAPYSKNISRWYSNNWLKNYDNTIDLLNRLKCKLNIEYEDYPISIGTAFWAKSKALKKLIAYNWEYEDFDEEPLKDDGTLSHAIERVFPYIAQDCGYETKILMNTYWADMLLQELQYDLIVTFEKLGDNYGIRSLYELKNLKERDKEIIEFCNNSKNIYLYGAGDRAKDCIRYLRRLSLDAKGLIVTHKSNKQNEKYGIPIYQVDKIDNKNINILVAVSIKYQEDVVKRLNHNGYKNIYLF